jgi:hypothetical protein
VETGRVLAILPAGDETTEALLSLQEAKSNLDCTVFLTLPWLERSVPHPCVALAECHIVVLAGW